MAKLEINQKAPDFRLVDTNMKQHTLSDFLSKTVVLAFYPGAFTAVCTKEMCTFRDSMAMLNELNAQVVGISVNDPFTNKAFAKANSLNFPLLSDYSREAVTAFGIADTNFAGLEGYTVAKRSIFIIDNKGKIRYIWISDDPLVEPNYAEIEEILGNIEQK
ncbi:MAG: peroxiredoxin [Candidatus Hodarchaeota archaeon]